MYVFSSKISGTIINFSSNSSTNCKNYIKIFLLSFILFCNIHTILLPRDAHTYMAYSLFVQPRGK